MRVLFLFMAITLSTIQISAKESMGLFASERLDSLSIRKIRKEIEWFINQFNSEEQIAFIVKVGESGTSTNYMTITFIRDILLLPELTHYVNYLELNGKLVLIEENEFTFKIFKDEMKTVSKELIFSSINTKEIFTGSSPGYIYNINSTSEIKTFYEDVFEIQGDERIFEPIGFKEKLIKMDSFQFINFIKKKNNNN